MSLATLRRFLLSQTVGSMLIGSLALFGLVHLARAQESFLVTTDDNSFSVFDLATYQLQKTMTAGYFTHSVIVGANPRLAFLSANTEPMSVVDLTIGREIKKIPNVWGVSATLTDDGKSVLVWDFENSTLDIVDVASLTVTKRVNLVPAMGSQAGVGGTVVQLGNKAFLAPVYLIYSPNNNYVTGVVHLSTFEVTAIPLPFNNSNYFYYVGWTGNAAATPDGKYVAMVLEAENGQGEIPELLLINTTTYEVLSQTLTVDYPDAIVVTPNRNDPSKYFGYITGFDDQSYNQVAAVVDFRPGSQTYGQVLPNTTVQLPNFYRDNYGSGLAINSDGSKLVIAGDGQQQFGPNLLVLDTGKMLTDPTNAIIDSQIVVGGANTYGLGIGIVNLTPPNSAPTVTGVQGDVTNDKATEITVTGTNFMDGALVRIGGIPFLPASVDNGNSLRVTVPINAPADPGIDVIVTNPETNNGLDQQYQSGLLAGQLKIGLNPAFQPQQQFASLNFSGYGTVRTFDLKQRAMTTFSPPPVLPGVNAIEFTSDGADLFGADPIHLWAWNTATGQLRGNYLYVPSGLPRRRPLAPSTDPLTGKPVVYTATRDTVGQDHDLLLDVIDADPQSPTFNTILRQIPAGSGYYSPSIWAVVSKPDGKYVYVWFTYYSSGSETHLAIYDTVHSTATVVSTDRFNLQTGQYQPTISPDGKWLVLMGFASRGNQPYQLKVLDIGTDPNNPRLVGLITPPRMRGDTYFDIRSYVIAGNHLFALGPIDPTIVAFNFNPANNDYRPDVIYHLPGEGDYVYSPLAASPDGKYIYAAIEDDSLIAILDADKLAHNQDPLVTTIADSDSAHYLAVSPVPPPAKLAPKTLRQKAPTSRAARDVRRVPTQ